MKAWIIVFIGVGVEVFIATLDYWFDLPHLIYEVGSGFRVDQSH